MSDAIANCLDPTNWGTFLCTIDLNYELVIIVGLLGIAALIVFTILLVVVILSFIPEFSWWEFFGSVFTIMWDIFVWFMDILGVLKQFDNYISFYNKLSPLDVVIFWQTLLEILIWLVIIAVHMLWYVKAFFLEYW